jgi:hypothetical protein
MTIATITALGFENKVKNNIHNMDNKKFDRLVAESTRSSLMESQRIDEGGFGIGSKIVNGVKNAWKGFQAARKGEGLALKGLQASRAAKAGQRFGHGMGFGSKAAQAEVNAFKSVNQPRYALSAAERLNKLQRNANRWRMAGAAGLAGLAGYSLGGGSGNAPGAAMAGAGMDGTYPGTDMSGGTIGGMYSGGMYPGGDMGGMYSGGMYPGGGYGDGFYDPDPNSLYAYMGGNPYGYGYDDMYGYGYGDPYGYGYGDPYGYGYSDPYGYGYGGAYDDGGMDPMMMYYMMNGGF